MMLSINQRRGNFSLRSDCERYVSDGDEHDADAGVLIIPPDQVETYFQGGGFQPTRATTLIPTVPRLGVACIVSGFTAEGAEFFTAEGPGGAYSWVHATLAVVSARLVESDDVHHWLDASRPSGDTKAIEPGEFNGMSGCGFWSVSMNPQPISRAPLTYDVRFHLHGVHTATVRDRNHGIRLRQTPIAHHLRLLAKHRPELREMIGTCWPEIQPKAALT
jgi:hypothetical protein